MDYIYSCLNDDVASREMHGSETNTAVVTVNAATNTISVDVKPISPSMLNVTKPTESGSYILQETISALGEVSYSWATLEDYNQEVTQAITNLTQQLEQEKQERIESVQTEANVRELADTQLRTEFTSELAQEKQEREQAINAEAQRTDSMINQLNDNVQSGFNIINDVLTTSINNINNAILNESTVREKQYQDTDFRIKDLNTRLGVEIDNRERRDAEIYANLSTDIANEKRERIEQDQDIRNSISIGLEEERQARADADETLQSNIDAEANERKSVDQHLWDILPDNIIAGTPMQGMENGNAINIVFSKYQKHGIGEDPADAELVEVPNQAITLFPATQEVAGVLTAADKTKIDNIATDIETAVQTEANAREEADNALSERITAIEDTNVLQSQILGDGRIQTTINSPAGRTFDIDVVDISNASNDDRFTVTLNNNDSISAMLTDGTTSVPLVFMSKWNKVEVGGSGAPLNLNSDDGKVTVNDVHTLLDNTDKTQIEQDIETAVSSEQARAETAEEELSNSLEQEITRATNKENSIDEDLQSFKSATNNSIVQIENDLATEGNRITTLDNNAVKKTGQSDQIIQGNVSIQGNLTVDGTTTTNDTETLIVQDNLIVTNGGRAEISNLSGLGINTDSTTTFGIVYDPAVDELKAGFGTLSDTNEFTFNENEGNPVALRNSDGQLTNGNILMWTDAGHKLIDSDIPATQIARKDQAQTFNGIQTFVNAIEVPSINVNGVQLTSNVAGNIAVESQITDAVSSLVNGANDGYQNFGEVESTVSAINTDLQEYKTSTNQNITQLENDLASEGNRITQAENNIRGINSNLSQMNSAIQSAQSCATNAYTYAGEASTLANTANTAITNHVANVNNPHQVTAEQVGLGNVDNTSDLDKPISTATACAIACISACMAEVSEVATNANANITTHIANINNPHNVTKAQVGLSNVADVDTTNASNINSGTLALNRIAEGLVAAGTNVSVSRDSESGVYTISATTPTVPTLHSVNLSTNNGSASTVIGNVYSNSATPIEISIPTISVVRGTPTGNGVAVVDIQVTTEGNVVTITPVLGPVNDGTLDDNS